MNPRIRLAFAAGLLLLAGAARAASTSTSYPGNIETSMESPQPSQQPSQPYLDYTNCPTPQEQEKVQLQAVLQVPDQDRGPVIAKGGCAVASTDQKPSTVDDRYSIGE